MSGVILEDGTQYEHCNVCGGFVNINTLHYEQKSEKHPYGRDVCSACSKLSPAERDRVAEAGRRRWVASQLAKARENGWTAEVVERDHGGTSIEVTGPFKVRDRVYVGSSDEPGFISSIDLTSTKVWVRRDNNPIPSGQRGAAEKFERSQLVLAE